MGNEKDFQQYLLDNENNPEADIILKKILEDVPSENAMLAEEGFKEFALRTGLKRRSFFRAVRRTAISVAASLFLPLLAISIWGLRKASDANTPWAQVNTTFSETRELSLPDGTKVQLRPCSQIIYPEKFFGRTRKVLLTGEAFLDVAKDARRKFVVSAGDMDITVHGTRFNVSSFPGNEEDEVALLEGSVEMSLRGRGGSVFLSPGELVKYDKQSGTVERRSFAANYYEDVLRAGGLQFNNERLADIAASLTRQFNVNVVVADESLASERYFASFINGEGLDDILAALNTGGHFRINKKNSIIYLSK
ncbi:MAG: FecR domain-containing protein [Bacteroidales bacterium]|nr:FecR domain-containing protein [Bacteroidales bacterium]